MKILFKILLMYFVASQVVLASGRTDAVKQFVKAFNQRDIDAMLDLAASDMRWMSIAGHTIAIETSNRAELKEAMLEYFANIPSAKSEIRQLNESGSFVYSLEKALWLVEGEERSQCSMAIYQFAKQKIQHVWYFPSHQCK